MRCCRTNSSGPRWGSETMRGYRRAWCYSARHVTEDGEWNETARSESGRPGRVDLGARFPSCDREPRGGGEDDPSVVGDAPDLISGERTHEAEHRVHALTAGGCGSP